MRRRRLERVAVAEALAADARRDPAEVLSDVGHQADWVMRRAREEIRTDQLTVDTMSRLVEAADQAGRWAKTALDADVDQRLARVQERDLAAVATVVQDALVAEIGDPDVRARIVGRIGAGLRALSAPARKELTS